MTGLPSDHPDVDTVEGRLERDAAGRLRVALPAGAADRFPTGDGAVIRLVVDGRRRHATVDTHLTDDRVLIAGAYDGPDRARDPGDAVDRLAEWAEDRGLDEGRAVLVDVVSENYLYGLREPGRRVVYDDPGRRDSGLDDIARRLGDS